MTHRKEGGVSTALTKELNAEATSKDFLIVRSEGQRKVRREIRHYNLDAIISVGYRVHSKRAVRFRQWKRMISRSMDGDAMNWHDYIHSDASVLVGKPIIKGTRLSVEFLLGLMAEGWTDVSPQRIEVGFDRSRLDEVG